MVDLGRARGDLVAGKGVDLLAQHVERVVEAEIELGVGGVHGGILAVGYSFSVLVR